MSNPGPPEVVSRRPWRLFPLEGTDWDFWFDVPTGWQAARPEEVREAQDPNGGTPTLLTVSHTVQPLRLTVPIRINARSRPQREARMAQLDSLLAGRGPYQLIAPLISSDPLIVTLIPAQGGTIWTPSGYAWTTTVTMQEVGAVPVSGAGLASLTWDVLDAQPGLQYTMQVTWKYSGTDQSVMDALILHQSGITGDDVAASYFDPTGAWRWYSLAGTGAQRSGAIAVTLNALVAEAFPDWFLSYYSAVNGFVANELEVNLIP